MMKKDSLISYLLYIPLSFVLVATKLFSFETVSSFGRFLGGLVYIVYGKRQRVAKANLTAAFKGKLSSQERQKIVKGLFHRMGQNFAQLIFAPRMNK